MRGQCLGAGPFSRQAVIPVTQNMSPPGQPIATFSQGMPLHGRNKACTPSLTRGVGHTRYLRSCPEDFLGSLVQFNPAGDEHGPKKL
jgi:hypothetical protein